MAHSPSTEAQLWDCPDLLPLMLHTVTLTGKTLGCGSYGSVEEVEVTGAPCAAKKIHDFLTKQDSEWLAKEKADSNIQKFISECKMMSRLRHPNIVQFLGIWVSQESLYLVMEKMMMSLHELLVPDDASNSVQLSSQSCIILGLKYSILQDIIRGLAFLHKQKPPIVHRDLSARNVLLNSAMVAKIADMGMARITPALGTMMTKQPGACVYMPPEALEDRYDTSIDLFSLGVVALFVLTQEFPRELKAPTYTDPVKGLVARTELERREKYTSLITYPRTHPLVQLMESCLQNRPEDRPSIDQALELLGQAVAGIQETTCATLSSSKLQLLQKNTQLLQQHKMKSDIWRDEAKKLKDKVTELQITTARLQKMASPLDMRTGVRRQSESAVGKMTRHSCSGDQLNIRYDRLQSEKGSSDDNKSLIPLSPLLRQEDTVKPHLKMETWYREISREQSNELLRGCVNGTFLCRLSSEQIEEPEGGLHTHTIDVVYDGVRHVKIVWHRDEYKLPLMQAPLGSFDSLMKLVLFFSEHGLPFLSGEVVILKFPRFIPEAAS